MIICGARRAAITTALLTAAVAAGQRPGVAVAVDTRVAELISRATVVGDGHLSDEPPFLQVALTLETSLRDSAAMDTGQTQVTLTGPRDSSSLEGHPIAAKTLLPGIVRDGSRVNVRLIRGDDNSIEPVSLELCAGDRADCQLAYYRTHVRIDPVSWRERAIWSLIGPVTAAYAARTRRAYPYWIQGTFEHVFPDLERARASVNRDIELYGKPRFQSDGPLLSQLAGGHRHDEILAEVVSQMPAEGRGFVGLWPFLPLRIFLRTPDGGWREVYDIDRVRDRR